MPNTLIDFKNMVYLGWGGLTVGKNEKKATGAIG
jgi:hypothetical protein